MRCPKVMRARTGNKNFFMWPSIVSTPTPDKPLELLRDGTFVSSKWVSFTEVTAMPKY